MPLILIVIDELSDLMMAANEVERDNKTCTNGPCYRYASCYRNEHPSVDVITGLIKANITSRLALTLHPQSIRAQYWIGRRRKA